MDFLSKFFAGFLTFVGFGPAPSPVPVAQAPKAYVVQQAPIADEKAVFATIQSVNVVSARARIAGTVADLLVRQGDRVEQGQIIALVGDKKFALQINSYAAQVAAAQAQMAQARLEYDRAKRLIASGAIARNMFDQARTNYNVALSNVQSANSQTAVIRQQRNEGEVLAPVSGRVMTVPVTSETVVMAGEVIASIAEQNFVLRLRIPERHARHMKMGDPVRLEGADLGLSGARFGKITLVYPQVDNGHVVADAKVEGLSDYFVGQRVRVWVTAGTRKAIAIPEKLIATRSGMDYVRLTRGKNESILVPVQRGQIILRKGEATQIEILSGLKAGDRLVAP